MFLKILPSFLFYAYLMGITPGPANLCSLGTAVQYGKKQALKQWSGIFVGFSIDSLASVFVAYFLGTALDKYVFIFSIIGAVYLVYLAIHFLRSVYSNDYIEVRKPGFLRGLLIQFTNVKVMLTCLTALTTYILPLSGKLIVLLGFGILLIFTGPVCNLVWVFAGSFLSRFFVKYQKLINIIMAFSLIICAVSLFLI